MATELGGWRQASYRTTFFDFLTEPATECYVFELLSTRSFPKNAWKPDVGKNASENAAQEVESAYQSARAARPLPEVDPALLRFMVEECDFDVEHADGSFLDHLYFCFEYSVQHFPDHSPIIMLLHSILGTGTNTFAMEAEKIPALKALMDAEANAQAQREEEERLWRADAARRPATPEGWTPPADGGESDGWSD